MPSCPFFFDDDEDDYDYEYMNDDYSYSNTADIWVADDFTAQSDDGNITAAINNVYISSEGCTEDDFTSSGSYTFNSYLDDVYSVSWEKIIAEITVEAADEDMAVWGVGVCAYDANDTLMYSTFTSFDDTDSRQSTSSKWVNVPITESAPRIAFTVYVYTGTDTEYVDIKSAYTQIIDKAQ